MDHIDHGHDRFLCVFKHARRALLVLVLRGGSRPGREKRCAAHYAKEHPRL